MGKIIYRKEQYCIQEVFSNSKKGYIIFNTDKEFMSGHSHLNNYKAAKYVISLALNQKLPLDLDLYRMESLYRILEDSEFRDKVFDILTRKKKKETKKYINIGKRVKVQYG